MTAPTQPAPGASRRPRQPWRAASRVPSFSGKSSAGVLGACFLFAALVFPLTLHLPVWLEVEVVMLAWWAIWTAALSYMLHQGRRISDDHRWERPVSRGGNSWLDGGGWDFSMDGEGILGFLAGLLLFILVLLALWLLWEFVLPAVALLGYMLVRGMVAHVINDPHDCKDNVGRSLTWGVFWATAYTGPLALLVWAIHRWALALHT